MRKLLLMALPCLLLLGAAGCKGKSDEPENMKGSVPRPTNWVVPTDYDYSSSMTAIIRLPDALQATQKAEDLLAAFDAAGHCLGVASPSTKACSSSISLHPQTRRITAFPCSTGLHIGPIFLPIPMPSSLPLTL